MVVPFVLAVATTWAIQYFFFGKKDAEQQYQFSAPQSQVENQPLMKNVKFADTKPAPETITPVVTSWGTLEFNSAGAIVNRLEFKRKFGNDTRIIDTIFPAERNDRANRAFLVALSEETPFNYELISRKEEGSTILLEYQAESSLARVRKLFTVYKEIRQLDLKVTVEPLGNKAIHARLFYPAPIMPELREQEQIAGDVMYGSDVFKKIYRDSIAPDTYWVKPIFFGAENKYFAHVLVADRQRFAQRSYYKLEGKEGLISILEGPSVSSTQSWNMSFYLGPKEEAAMNAVDERLDKLLDYSGIWAPVSRLLLMLLNWLNDYVHSYGLAIILLTLLMKLLLLPFSLKAERSMQGRNEMQKRLQYIQQKYKDDPQARAQAQAEHMRKHGLGLAGCLPMLVQIPIFFGLSRVLSSSIELYKTPFLWMADLSARDPYYILPALVLVGMLASAFSAPSGSSRLPIIAMAFGFGAVSSSMSAGLVMYIALSTLLNVLQTAFFKFFRLA